MASRAAQRSSPAFPAPRPRGVQPGVICQKTRLGRRVGEAKGWASRAVGEPGARAVRPRGGGFGRNRSPWGLACLLATGRASSHPPVDGADAGRIGVGAGPEAPHSQPVPVCQSGRTRPSWRGAARSPMALAHTYMAGTGINRQAATQTPPAPPGRAPRLQARLQVFLTVQLGGVGCSRPRKHENQWCQRENRAQPSHLLEKLTGEHGQLGRRSIFVSFLRCEVIDQ